MVKMVFLVVRTQDILAGFQKTRLSENISLIAKMLLELLNIE